MRGMVKASWGEKLAWAGLIGGLYFLLARLSLNFVVQPEGIAIIWPANGFLLAVLLLSQQERWLLLLGTAGLGNFAANMMTGEAAILSFGLAVVNCIEVGLAAWLMDHFFERPITLARLKEVVGLVGLVAGLSNGLAALWGATLVHFSSGVPFLTTWQVWWVANGMGTLVVTPVLLTWAARISSHKPLTWSRMIEGGLLLGLLTVMTQLIFRSNSEIGLFVRPSYITLPFLVWAAVRFGPRGATLASLILASISISYTVRGVGPFVSINGSAEEEALGLQLFLSVTTFSYLALAAVMAEHRQAEEQLHFQKQELESANRELNDFAYAVSHDLKAPLRSIGLLANWISTDQAAQLGEEGQRQLNLLQSRVKLMHALIDGILQYSQVGRTRESEGEVDLNRVVAEVIELIAPPVHIIINIESQLPVVVGDRTRLQQLFQNLLSNGIKFMDKPRGEIRVGCIEQDGYWEFSVADNGPGIEAKYFDKIFELFKILTPRDREESTGVGLALVKKIVELYGGKVWVESEVGQGTTFFFTWPKREKEGRQDEKPEVYLAGGR